MANQGEALRWAGGAKFGQGRLGQGKILRADAVLRDVPILQLRVGRGASGAKFVEPVIRVNHQHVLAAQALEHFRQGGTPLVVEDPEHLTLGPCGVRQRAKDVEEGADLKGLAHRTHEAHGAVVTLGKHKSDAQFFDALGHGLRG